MRESIPVSERDLRPALPRQAGTKVSLLSWAAEPMQNRSNGDMKNNLKTFVLMAGLMGMFLLIGQLLGGMNGLHGRRPRTTIWVRFVYMCRAATKWSDR